LLAALPAAEAELALLSNGYAIHSERRETRGAVTRLYLGAGSDSYVDVPTSSILGFQAEEAPPSVPALPAPVSSPPGAATATPPPQPLNRLALNSRALNNRALNNQALNDRALNDRALNNQALEQMISSASGHARIDPDFIHSVIHAESDFNPRAVSPKGAQGLMQLMPETATDLGVKDAFDPQSNVEAGTRYLRELLERYHFDVRKALAAYNAGPLRVDRYNGVPPYYETQAYIARIIRDFNRKKLAEQKAARVASTHVVHAKAQLNRAP
jgi:soluble lytic murein transglycosylase-like protein